MLRLGDSLEVLRSLPSDSVHCCITSPPYWRLRDYGVDGQLGMEKSPEEYVQKMVEVFREVRRVLRPDGTLWLNLGDSYASTGGAGRQGKSGVRADRAHSQSALLGQTSKHGIKPKDLVGIPWRVAFALQADGWYLRQDIIWHKPNPMPESVRDRCTKAHEYIFLLAKSERYYFDSKAIQEPLAAASADRYAYAFGGAKSIALVEANRTGIGRRTSLVGKREIPQGRNRRSVWSVTTRPFRGAHFATFPPDLIDPCVLAGCPAGGTVLDPFFGAGTTGMVAKMHGRAYIGIEINPEYAAIAEKRIEAVQP